MLAPFAALLMFASTLPVASAQTHNESAHPLELSRPVRPWEFLPLVGTRAALFGDESGSMEAWVYPLKFLREFRLQFHEAGRVVPAEALARMIIVRPESSTIVWRTCANGGQQKRKIEKASGQQTCETQPIAGRLGDKCVTWGTSLFGGNEGFYCDISHRSKTMEE